MTCRFRSPSGNRLVPRASRTIGSTLATDTWSQGTSKLLPGAVGDMEFSSICRYALEAYHVVHRLKFESGIEPIKAGMERGLCASRVARERERLNVAADNCDTIWVVVGRDGFVNTPLISHSITFASACPFHDRCSSLDDCPLSPKMPSAGLSISAPLSIRAAKKTMYSAASRKSQTEEEL